MTKNELNNPFSSDYLKGFDQGQKHATPNNETVRQLSDMKIEVRTLAHDMKELVDLKSDLKVLNERLDNLITSMSNHSENLKELEKRTRMIEEGQSTLMAKVGIIATLGSATVVALINKFI